MFKIMTFSWLWINQCLQVTINTSFDGLGLYKKLYISYQKPSKTIKQFQSNAHYILTMDFKTFLIRTCWIIMFQGSLPISWHVIQLERSLIKQIHEFPFETLTEGNTHKAVPNWCINTNQRPGLCIICNIPCDCYNLMNSLWPSVAIRQERFLSILVQVMAINYLNYSLSISIRCYGIQYSIMAVLCLSQAAGTKTLTRTLQFCAICASQGRL